MKRVLSLKNRAVVISVLAGLLFTASSFTFGPFESTLLVDNAPQKKEQMVKVTVNKNGKETKIDTTFNLPDEKMIQVKVDSMLKKIEIEGIEPGMKNIVIHRGGNHMNWSSKDGDKFPGNEQFDILIQSGDSGMRKHVRKIIHMSDDGSIYSIGRSEGDEMLPPLPPMPPSHSIVRFMRFGGDPFALDPKDESIISYDKKDIGKGLEKITIIRKKKVENEKMEEINVKTEITDESKK